MTHQASEEMSRTTDVEDVATVAVGGGCNEIQDATKEGTQKQLDGAARHEKQHEKRPHSHTRKETMATYTKLIPTKKTNEMIEASKQRQQ